MMAVATFLFGVFLWREVFPEYKIFQDAFVQLEEFRSTVTGEAPAPFKVAVKQIVLTQERGPEVIDRCISCHVALEIPHFSPTKIAKDINGNVLLDANGLPQQVANDDYIWKQLDNKITELTDEKVLQQFRQEGRESEANDRIAQADQLKRLKTAEVDGRQVDMTKVLAMHPLIGKESRPFEFHPLNEYGCTSCHNGNGRALTIARAHGPVFDGHYEEAFEGPAPQFLESDPQNDPAFSRMFNHKPGHQLLFQTSPIYPGRLIQANCVQCHLTSFSRLQGAVSTVSNVKNQVQTQAADVQTAFSDEKKAVLSLLSVKNELSAKGYDGTLAELKAKSVNYTLPEADRNAFAGQVAYLTAAGPRDAVQKIDRDLTAAVGNESLISQLQQVFHSGKQPADVQLQAFIDSHPGGSGSLFVKARAVLQQQLFLQHVDKAAIVVQGAITKDQIKQAAASETDRMLACYQQGEELFFTQACYACHRISGLSRGGVGPELTTEGNSYPWFVKQSIVWPQADLKTSTMPNFRLDHPELEALMCFMLGQKGRPRVLSQVDYDTGISLWESGQKLPWEQSVELSKVHDLHYGMALFATEGCAACHRLKGYESSVGFSIEKGRQPTFDELYQERDWFSNAIPEDTTGSQIAKIVQDRAQEFDQHIVDGVREPAILEELEARHPGLLESFYSPFGYALRAYDHRYEQQLAAAKTPEEAQQALTALNDYRARVNRVLKMFIQEYGLGRLIGPRPNWSGIYRSDEWLMEHFYNPSMHSAHSIMPAFPFDETKFYTLVNMLDALAIKNSAAVRQIWDNRGFNPAVAFHIHCSQCHGDYRQGDGPVAEWIYPIPKNLRNASFLRNLTPRKVRESIMHGVKGGPMPPWGEIANDKTIQPPSPVLKPNEIDRLVEWLYMSLPEEGPKQAEPLKWLYTPEDVLRELREEGDTLKSNLESDVKKHNPLTLLLPRGEGYLASLKPKPTSPPDTLKVDEVFDVKPNPIPGADRVAYYIKDKYYTPENLAEGERVFLMHCAICHGKEAAGNGLRAGTMVEAKPRMLTNLDWIETRDDLRLLQSIKYGVLGTAMTPWGDQTSTLQRLQLVMYIRSLSRDKIMREHLAELLYQIFDRNVETIRQAQIAEYQRLKGLENNYHAAEAVKDELDAKLARDSAAVPSAIQAYQKQLLIGEQVRKQKAVDKSLQNLITLVKKQKELYNNLCTTMLARLGDAPVVTNAISLIGLNAIHYDYNDGHLSINEHSADSTTIVIRGKEIVEVLDQQIAQLEKDKLALLGQFPSTERHTRLTEVEQRLHSYRIVREQVISATEEAARGRNEQVALLEKIHQQIKLAHQEENDEKKTNTLSP